MTAKNMQEEPANTQTEETALIPIAEIASTTEWMNQVAIINRRSTDLVNLDVVQNGYMLHGKPSSMAFMNLNQMTSSRMKKKFPFYDKNDPLFAMLEAKVKYVVGQGIVKKYEAYRDGTIRNFDHMKWINAEVEKVFNDFVNWRPHYLEIADGTKNKDSNE